MINLYIKGIGKINRDFRIGEGMKETMEIGKPTTSIGPDRLKYLTTQ